MAGGKSVSENYAFAGMHHIFDQHAAAGEYTWIQLDNYLQKLIFHIYIYNISKYYSKINSN